MTIETKLNDALSNQGCQCSISRVNLQLHDSIVLWLFHHNIIQIHYNVLWD
jgi:hypothetical protein